MLAMGAAFLVAYLVVAVTAPLLERLYASLLSPITTVRIPMPQADTASAVRRLKDKWMREMPSLRGLFMLFATYFATGVIFAFTGGTAGFVASDAFNGVSVPPEVALRWGFLVGILFAGIARIRASGASQVLADGLSSLAVLTLGASVFLVVADIGVLKAISPVSYIRHNLFSAPAQAIVVALAAVLWVEAMIFLRERYGGRYAREVTRAGVRQRAEQHEYLEQVFWPTRVEPETDKVIEGAIMADGLQSICWMTNTAPVSHCKTIVAMALRWAQDHCAAEKRVDDLARRLIGANLRVIVPSREMLRQVRKQIPWLKRWRITNTPSFRTRILTLNGRVAVMHLPIPYMGSRDEQSNSAAISRNVESIQELQGLFDSIWESLHLDYVQHAVAQAMADGAEHECLALLAISEHDHGITLAQLQVNLTARGGALADSALRTTVHSLLKKKLISYDRTRSLYYSRRRQHVCHTLDSLTRLVCRNMVVDPPLGDG